MPAQPVFSIGIDLGTTNCCLAFVDLNNPSAPSQALSIPQRADLASSIESSALPSFLYWPTEAERGPDFGLSHGWIVGLAARNRSLTTPDRVAHSAKSWLCHHTHSPEAKILPWKSASLDESQRLSPIAASAALLAYLRDAWNAKFAPRGDAFRFERQSITIAVPASFDVAAQRATLDAALAAGFPANSRLLEEPQAAFYRWLEQSANAASVKPGQRILVVDIGGGTSDFTVFAVQDSQRIERVAVSDHILLGGDNIDLALAHALESELAPNGQELSPDQWGHLIARSRELKERCLADAFRSGETFSVSIPSRGSGLFAGSLSTTIDGDDARQLLLEGFFPACPPSASPSRHDGGLLEWGLPYAPDCAVTRHLAAFLRTSGGPIDSVLFNGGTLASSLLQQRILDQIAAWQGGPPPARLENPETDLAVARGAAYYGSLGHRGSPRIAAGLARALYLEIGVDGENPALLCALPRGAQPEDWTDIALAGLRLATNRSVRFQAWQGNATAADAPGSLRPAATDFTRLPPMDTRIDLPGPSAPESIAVRLRSAVTETGVLRVLCVADDDSEASWELAFNLRQDASSPASSPTLARPAASDPATLRQALALLKDQVQRSTAKASRIFAKLELSLARPRHEWTLPELRQLADALLSLDRALAGEPARAEAWLQLAGYCLRPGFGYADDPARIERLWLLLAPLLSSKTPARVEAQAAILWRRVAGGLSPAQQADLLAAQGPLSAKLPAERIRLLGALEKLPASQKRSLAEWCLDQGLAQAKSSGYPAPYFAAMGQLLSRSPFNAGPDCVVPPETVLQTFERLRKLDWREPPYAELPTAFLKAARVVDDRALDLPARDAQKIAAKLEKSGLPTPKTAPLLAYHPLTRADHASQFGESLPPGLTLQ